jgi:hypothetical protein
MSDNLHKRAVGTVDFSGRVGCRVREYEGDRTVYSLPAILRTGICCARERSGVALSATRAWLASL